MAIELLNLSSPNDGLGDTLRDGGVKINNNFTFLDTTKQNADADLNAIAGLAGTSGLLRKIGANNWTLDTASYLRSDQSGTLTGTLTATAFVGNGSGLTNVNASQLSGLTSTQFLRSDAFNSGSTGSIQLNDGFGFIVGTDSDAIFRHSGGNNLIDLNSGNLIIRDVTTDRFTFGRTTGNFTWTGVASGNGSGITNVNAASLSGVSAGQFLRSDVSDTMSGTLTLTGNLVASAVNTGQGATEVYLMDQNVRTTDFVNFGRVYVSDVAANSFGLRLDSNSVNLSGIYFSSAEDGQLYLRSAAGTPSILSPDGAGGFSTGGNIVCGQINTGQGLTEVYAMNQNVRTTDSPSFSALTATNAVTAGSFVTSNWTIDQNGTTLEFRYNGVTQMTLSSTGELLVNDRAGEF